MRNVLFTLLCVAACSTSSDEKPVVPPDEPVRPLLYEPPQLDGAGSCLDPVCTLHFSVDATGDVESFSSARCTKPGCRSWRGKLTPKAKAKVRELAARLIKEKFEPVYGCGRRCDGPEHEVIIHHPDGRVLSHTLDPIRPVQVPPLLLEASKLIQAFSDTLDRCETNDLFVPAPDCKEITEVELKRPSGFP